MIPGAIAPSVDFEAVIGSLRLQGGEAPVYFHLRLRNSKESRIDVEARALY
jgi:hypothetical protein